VTPHSPKNSIITRDSQIFVMKGTTVRLGFLRNESLAYFV